MPKNTKYFNILCNKLLTEQENMSLNYKQKVDLVNYIKKQLLADRKWESFTGSVYVDSKPVDYTGVGETLESLPLTERQRAICRYRIQRYTIPEISDLMYISEPLISLEIATIKQVMRDNPDLLVPEHDVMSRTTTSYNE